MGRGIRFYTDYIKETSVPLTGLAASTVGDCKQDQRVLPGIVISWAQPVPAATETFVQYEVWRSQPNIAPGVYTRMGVVSAIGTLSFVDYEVASRQTYLYYVVWVATGPSGTVTSVPQYVAGLVAFDFLWLSDKSAPTTRNMRFESWRANFNVDQDIVFRQPWGRQTPTMFIGDKQTRRVQLTGLDALLRDNRQWELLQTLVTAQRTLASNLVCRFGRSGDLLYCQIVDSSKAHDQKTFVPSLDIAEVYVATGV